MPRGNDGNPDRPATEAQRKAFALRLSAPVFDGIQRWADDELRSLNAQIEYLLRDALRRAGRWKDREPDADRDPQ